jgi:hypothetical protein
VRLDVAVVFVHYLTLQGHVLHIPLNKVNKNGEGRQTIQPTLNLSPSREKTWNFLGSISNSSRNLLLIFAIFVLQNPVCGYISRLAC